MNYPFKNLFSSSANESLTLPAIIFVFCLSFHSVVDKSDIQRVDERPAQLLPCVHNQLLAMKVAFLQIRQLNNREMNEVLKKLSKLDEWKFNM